MGVDLKTGLRLIGAPQPAPPITVEDSKTGEKLLFPQTAMGVLSRDALNSIVTEVTRNVVTEVTRNVTSNIISNMCARLKDRCAFTKHDGTTCRISRAAHHCNEHDFTEPQVAPSANGARR